MTTHIAIAVVKHGNNYLIGQRHAHVKLAGYWEFPGGKVEVNETSPQAAVRECVEETGLKVVVQNLLLEQEFEYPHGKLLLQFFACKLTDATHFSPLAPFQWVAQHELPNYQFPDGNRQLLELLKQ